MKHTPMGIWACSFLFVLLFFATPRTEAQSAAPPPAQPGPVVPDSGTDCNGTYTGTFIGNLTVSAGQSCVFDSGGVDGNLHENGGDVELYSSQVTGNVQATGGNLILDSSTTVAKNVQISGAVTFAIGPSLTVGGNLQIQNETAPAGSGGNGAAPAGGGAAPAAPPAAAAPAGGGSSAPPAPKGCSGATYQICGTTVQGNLQFQNNAISIQIYGSAISGNLQAQNNSAEIDIENNTVTGNLEVSNNQADTTVRTNTVNGNLEDQNNTSPDQTPADVDTNTVGKNLQCQNNSPGTSSPNNTVTRNNQCYQ